MNTPDGPATTSAPSEVMATPGEVLGGKYLVTRIIGRGGMGVVVEAKHLSLDEKVAVKILHRRYLDNAEALARFHLEAKAAVKIRGEHSARLIDVGSTALGEPYIVMELLEGADLATIVRSGPLTVQEAVLYMLQACEGMAECHANGIIHRDLKPGNLFVTRRPDGSPLVKVLDFGIAKNEANEKDGEWALTMTLVALGTPFYMSPEQIRSSRDVDERTDVWSLGVILYELLTGKPPFAGGTVAQITAQVLEAKPPPLAKVRADVPAELDRIVAQAMAKKAEQRFGDVAALAAALAPFAGTHAGREHAARAARILENDGRQRPVMPFNADTTNRPFAAADSMLDTDLGATAKRRERSTTAKRKVAPIALVGLCATLAVLVFALRSSPKEVAPARAGIAPAAFKLLLAARDQFRPEERAALPMPASTATGTTVLVTDLPEVTSTKGAPRRNTTQAAPPGGKRNDDDALTTRK